MNLVVSRLQYESCELENFLDLFFLKDLNQDVILFLLLSILTFRD